MRRVSYIVQKANQGLEKNLFELRGLGLLNVRYG
jgi:hypothetical protein